MGQSITDKEINEGKLRDLSKPEDYDITVRVREILFASLLLFVQFFSCNFSTATTLIFRLKKKHPIFPADDHFPTFLCASPCLSYSRLRVLCTIVP